MGTPWRAGEGCVIVRVRVTPKSGKDAIEGVTETAGGPAFAARVRAAKADGKANAAVTHLFAARLGLPARAVRVDAGAKSRVKSLSLDGDRAAIERRLALVLTELDQNQNKHGGN